VCLIQQVRPLALDVDDAPWVLEQKVGLLLALCVAPLNGQHRLPPWRQVALKRLQLPTLAADSVAVEQQGRVGGRVLLGQHNQTTGQE
jgi:hypothetical protein